MQSQLRDRRNRALSCASEHKIVMSGTRVLVVVLAVVVAAAAAYP